MLEDGGMMFFRVNPGVQHDKPEAKWIEFFAWNVPFIIELAEMFNLKVLDIRDDSSTNVSISSTGRSNENTVY